MCVQRFDVHEPSVIFINRESKETVSQCTYD